MKLLTEASRLLRRAVTIPLLAGLAALAACSTAPPEGISPVTPFTSAVTSASGMKSHDSIIHSSAE